MPRDEVNRFSWRRMLLANTIGGVIMPLVVLWLDPRPNWAELWRTLLFSMTYSWSVGSTAAVSFMVAGPYFGGCSKRRAWSIVFGLLVFAATVGCAIGTTVITLLPNAPERWFSLFRDSMRFCLPIALGFGVVFALVEDARARLRTTTLELKTRELERERAEKLATEARLASLQSRVHPHFLFNALNSISSLIREDPARAERLIERMASILRYSLDANVVTLGQEMKTVRDYVDIEQARFGSRLRFESDIREELRDLEIPAMSIQTLVENSVKYAVSPGREGASIRVSADAQGDVLRVTVADDGPGFSPDQVLAGHGLDLLQSRLQTAFGSDAGLEFAAGEVRIRVPVRAGVRV